LDASQVFFFSGEIFFSSAISVMMLKIRNYELPFIIPAQQLKFSAATRFSGSSCCSFFWEWNFTSGNALTEETQPQRIAIKSKIITVLLTRRVRGAFSFMKVEPRRSGFMNGKNGNTEITVICMMENK
jgi:hypothetical protein